MEAIGLARRLVQLGEVEKALEGFELALRTQQDLRPEDKMEAALYVLQFGGSYKLAYQALLDLNHEGHFAQDTAAIMTEAFYEPNKADLCALYEQNCRQLRRYPYLFRKDFLPFEDLPIRFYPFDGKTYIPCQSGVFGSITDYREPVVTKNFFYDLKNPILAQDVYSQYELEYLNDSVRPSEWVARENHIYLHYTDWSEFCAHLQVINFRKLLKDQKFVFLIGDEKERYPIDFKAEFGIDYSRFPLKPVGLREINRLIWHTQLSYHNGGDFFNEVLDGHPNLICSSSIMNDSMERTIEDIRSTLDDARNLREILEVFDGQDWGDPRVIKELYLLQDRTDKDILVAYFCRDLEHTHHLDPAARIAPAILYQPHYGHIATTITGDGQGRAIMNSTQLDQLYHSPIFENFKYIKTFTPMRRFTTSYAASIRFMAEQPEVTPSGRPGIICDEIVSRVTFRGYIVDTQKRVWKDSVVVRFEDAKLNPLATFTALVRFLDVPLTTSMYQSTFNGKPLPRFDAGFHTAPVFQTYDGYANQAERCYLEFFLRDAYEYYGYDFHYYDGSPMDGAKVRELISHFDVLNRYMRDTMQRKYYECAKLACGPGEEGMAEAGALEEAAEQETEKYMAAVDETRLFVSDVLLNGLQFLNTEGLPLKFIPMLKPDPELLVQPLYH